MGEKIFLPPGGAEFFFRLQGANGGGQIFSTSGGQWGAEFLRYPYFWGGGQVEAPIQVCYVVQFGPPAKILVVHLESKWSMDRDLDQKNVDTNSL